MIFVTGDCHADWRRFNTKNFPEQYETTRDDLIIVCGDFGIWDNCKRERHWFDWIAEKSFTVLFVDGNHENFDRLYSTEFPSVDFHSGKAHKIRENLYHLQRGHVFTFEGKTFFTFGGAKTKDSEDGILEPNDYESQKKLMRDYRRRTEEGEKLRINHISWWSQELPTKEEMDFGMQTLADHDFKVDYVITHCAPQKIAETFGRKPDVLTEYLDDIASKLTFKKWFFGHYHDNKEIGKYRLIYEQIVRIV